jgi:hypothetical protein
LARKKNNGGERSTGGSGKGRKAGKAPTSGPGDTTILGNSSEDWGKGFSSVEFEGPTADISEEDLELRLTPDVDADSLDGMECGYGR